VSFAPRVSIPYISIKVSAIRVHQRLSVKMDMKLYQILDIGDKMSIQQISMLVTIQKPVCQTMKQHVRKDMEAIFVNLV